MSAQLIVLETSSAIRLHRKEMMEVAVSALKNNPVWVMKARAATMLARIVEVVSEDIDPSEAGKFGSILIVSEGLFWLRAESWLFLLTRLPSAIRHFHKREPRVF